MIDPRVRKVGPPRPPAKPFVIPHIPGPPKPGATAAHPPAAGGGSGSGKWDEEKHPRDHGKFSHTPGARGEQEKPAAVDHDERAKASLADPVFVREHAARLSEAGDAARSAFDRDDHHGDIAHAAAQEAIHNEAKRIHRERGGEAHDPDAAHAEHRATGERHRDDHHARVTREREEAEAKLAADATKEEKAGRIVPIPDEVTQAIDGSATVREARKAAAEKLGATAPDALAALAKVRELEREDLGIGGDTEGLAHASDLDNLHEELTGHGYNITGGDPDYDFDPFDGAPADDTHDEDIIENILDGAGAVPPGYEARRDHAKNVIDKRSAEHRAAAERARDALQAHLDEQEKALVALTAAAAGHTKLKAKADKALSKLENGDGGVNEDHFSEFERDPEDDTRLLDDHADDQYQHAQEVAGARLTQLRRQLEATEDDRPPEEDVAALKEYRNVTRDSIKALDRLLKPKKTRAKKSNRPGDTSAATVVGMARLSKLRLSKLQYVSLVDTPAQQTANVRLIKRKDANGADLKIQATAKVVKIGDGDSPLVYCWAFTCTDEHGQPYHDLQGDAIEPDAFIKAAEDFMHSGAAVDEMHDGKKTCRVAFAFPMDSDIARGMFGEAIGKQVKTSGLMVAIRPAPEALAKLRSGAYTGVSIAGIGTREALAAKRASPVRKGNVLMTTVEAGHQHAVDLTGYDDSIRNSGQTSSQTAEGAEEPHAHAWLRDPETGAIRIAMDSGHTHEVETGAEDMAEEDGAGEGGEEVYSPPDDGAPSVKSMSNLTLFKRALGLSEEHRAFLDQLAPEEAAELLNSGKLGDEFAKADAEDPVIFTSANGATFRKSADPNMVALAKRCDELAKDAEVQKAAREQVEFEKRAGVELVGFAKGLNVKVAVIKALDGIADEAIKKEAFEMLRGARAALAMLSKHTGVNTGDAAETETPVAKFNAARIEFAKTASKTDKPTDAQVRAATGAFIRTEEGAALYHNAYPTSQSA